MRILQITSSFLPVLGGQEKVVFETSKRLAKQGHSVTVLTTDLFCEKDNLPREETVEGFKIVRLKNNFLMKGYGYSHEAKRWLRENWKNYDIVHSHGYNRFLSEYALFYLRKKLPLVFSAHGFRHTKQNYLFKVLHDLSLGRFVKFADKCTALTKNDYGAYYKLGVKKENIFDLPNGVDVVDFSKKDSELIKKLKARYDVNDKTLLYIGRIHKSKGLQYLIPALKSLACKLLVVGQDGGYKKVLENKIKELDLEDKVVFTGPLSDRELVAACHLSDVFVLFSEWEGFGVVVIEAMASGLPVVVSDRGSLPSIVDDCVDGIIVPFGNGALLEDKLRGLLRDGGQIKLLGRNGKKKAVKYSWDNIISVLLGNYDKLLEE